MYVWDFMFKILFYLFLNIPYILINYCCTQEIGFLLGLFINLGYHSLICLWYTQPTPWIGACWHRPPLYVKNESSRESKWKFSNYKKEEHLVFRLYCDAPILEELGHTLATPLGAEGAILLHLSRLFSVVSRKQGWTPEMITNARLYIFLRVASTY